MAESQTKFAQGSEVSEHTLLCLDARNTQMITMMTMINNIEQNL